MAIAAPVKKTRRTPRKASQPAFEPKVRPPSQVGELVLVITTTREPLQAKIVHAGGKVAKHSLQVKRYMLGVLISDPVTGLTVIPTSRYAFGLWTMGGDSPKPSFKKGSIYLKLPVGKAEIAVGNDAVRAHFSVGGQELFAQCMWILGFALKEPTRTPKSK